MKTNVAIPDDIVEVILLRLDSLVCLVRAASTCKQWRRIVADAVFCRRYRSLHGQPVAAGTYHNDPMSQRPYFVPSPSATVDGRHFSLDFLPDIFVPMWRVMDSRGSLLLLRCYYCKETGWFSDLAICEPLTRRYEIIPPLSTSTNDDLPMEAFLVDSAHEGCDAISNFSVVCVLQGHNKTHAGVFTSGRRSWRGNFFYGHSWTITMGLTTCSIYFYHGEGRVTSMDLTTAELMSFVLPTHIDDWDNHVACHSMTVTAGRDSKPRFIVGDGFDLKIKVYACLQDEWILEKMIQFSNAACEILRYGCWNLVQAASPSLHRAGSVLIEQAESRITCLRLDIETAEMEPLPEHHDYRTMHSIQLPLSPTLRACT